MNDLYLRARHYFLDVESSRLPPWRRLLLWAFVAICLVGFGWGIRQFFGTLLSDWPNGKPRWLVYRFTLVCEVLVGGAYLCSVRWNRKAFLKHYQRLCPDKDFQDVNQIQTFLLEKLTGSPPDEFFGLYKEIAAVQAALNATKHSPAVNSRELSRLIYDPESKARIWTLLSIFCSVFSALALAKLTDASDFVALMTRQGWEFYRLLFAVAFIVVGSTLFFAYLAQENGRPVLAWVLAHFSRWGIGRDDVLDYLVRDLLRHGRTKLPNLGTAWPILPPQGEPSARTEGPEAPVVVEPPSSNSDGGTRSNAVGGI